LADGIGFFGHAIVCSFDLPGLKISKVSALPFAAAHVKVYGHFIALCEVVQDAATVLHGLEGGKVVVLAAAVNLDGKLPFGELVGDLLRVFDLDNMPGYL
jgi:hypothetical protein